MAAGQQVGNLVDFAIPMWWLGPRGEEIQKVGQTAARPVTLPARATPTPLAPLMYGTFMEKVTAVPAVKRVYARIDSDNDGVSVWTIIDTEDIEDEHQVLRAYGDIFRTFGPVPFQHLMINLADYSDGSYMGLIPPGAEQVLSR